MTGELVRDIEAVVEGGGVVVAAVAALVGWALLGSGVDILLPFPPLLAQLLPHVGPGTPAAVAIAGAVVIAGPAVAQRARWGRLLLAARAAAVAGY